VDEWAKVASSDLSDVDSWWARAAFSVLFATGHFFDVIEAPARLVAPLVHNGWFSAPIAVTPEGRWMLLVAPGEALRPELDAQLDVVLHGTGSWVPAPPTRTPRGRVRWVIHPQQVGWRLPDPYVVQTALVTQLTRTPPPATLAARDSRLPRAA
jgi:hypothetical protein